MGTGEFAVPSLEALLNSRYEVIGVVTQPDRPSGRGRQIDISPVKQLAVSHDLPIFQPEKVRTEDFIQTVTKMNPEAIVVASFGQIIPKSILDIPKFGCINVHGSLLPKYRGAAPVHYALFKGEKTTGVTTMLMDPGLDTGPMLLSREIEIAPEDNRGTLEAKLAKIGAELLLETLDSLERGTIQATPQDSSLAVLAPSVKREQCQIDWSAGAESIADLVRGCNPRPGAYTTVGDSVLKIWDCRVQEAHGKTGEPGEVLESGAGGIVVQAGDGTLLLTEVQPENKKRMMAGEFARGHQITRIGYHNTRLKS
jgi:methionyl-tRNA formyltransferase